MEKGHFWQGFECFGLRRQNYNFVNIYAPTISDYFFPNSVKILAGDFNCIESASDKFGGNFTCAKELKELRTNVRLVDIWRKTHGLATHCTWFNGDKSIGFR